MSQENIIVIDDDPDILKILKFYIEKENYNFFSADSFDEALEIIKSYPIDLIILDVMMPNKDGFDTCLEIRKYTYVPIIFLSCRSDEIDKIIGFSVGGDDYVSKPFLPAELLARIKANIRRSKDYSDGINSSDLISCGNLIINLLTREVFIDKKPITLLPKEFDILLLFAKNPNRIFSKDEIFKYIWKEDVYSADINTIMVHISNLRKKIGVVNDNNFSIVTYKGLGYKLIYK